MRALLLIAAAAILVVVAAAFSHFVASVSVPVGGQGKFAVLVVLAVAAPVVVRREVPVNVEFAAVGLVVLLLE